MPFGTVELQSRRTASTLEFATAYKSVINLESAVSGRKQNLQFWNDFVARNAEASKFSQLLNIPRKPLVAPIAGPWHIICVHLGSGRLVPNEQAEMAILHLNIVRTFILSFAS